MASAAATFSSAPLRLLSKPPRPLLSKPHLLVLSSSVSFQRLTARSTASPTTSSSTPSGSVDPAQLPPALREIVGLFQSVPDPRTRYKQLLTYAKRLRPMDPALKTDANRVRGCVSHVWVHAAPEGDSPSCVRFQADSDWQLTKELAALLVLGLSGAPVRDVAMVPVEFIELLGIRQSLWPSRNSGLLNMLNLMKRKALQIAGISSIETDGDDKIAVAGDGIDPIKLIEALRKQSGYAEIVTVSPVGEKEEEEKEEDKTDVLFFPPPPYVYSIPEPILEPAGCCVM